MKRDRRTILILFLAILLVAAYLFYVPVRVSGASTTGSSSAEANTPYGESLSIKLGGGSSTSGTASIIDVLEEQAASWLASYQDSTSQNVYEVNDTYKSQEQVTLSYSLTVTYANVENIQATVKIKAIDDSDSSSYEYTLANAKALSGASPISDSGQTTKTISQHLTDADAATSGATIRYQIYCQVTATGSISGDPLTATINYTPFGCLVYQQSSESSSAEVTPAVSVASILDEKVKPLDEALGLPQGTSLKLLAVVTVAAALWMVRDRWA